VDERLELAGDAAPVCRRRVSSVVGPRALIKEVQRWSGGGRSPGGNTQRVRAARAMATTTTASLGQRANKPPLPTAPTSLTPAPSSPSPSRPLPARPSTTSLSIPPGRCPRVPPPPRSSQFSRPRSSRPATTSLFAVLSAAARASRHHFALRSSPGRVHCVLPPPRAARSRRPRPVRRADASCARAPRASADGTSGAVRKARRVLGQLGASATGARREGAQRDEDQAGARRRAVSGGRENGGRQEGRTAHGAGAHGDRVRARGRGCAWRRGSGREARVERRLDGREGAVVGSRRGRDGRTREGGRRSGDREGATVVRELEEELGLRAEHEIEAPLMITCTTTVGIAAGHTDVSLWYVVRGNCAQELNFSETEFNDARWFRFSEVPFERSEPHLRRFITKLQSSAAG
jgi:8-oxo-dGTP pyrophosphatase MutT (NUDIX family)